MTDPAPPANLVESLLLKTRSELLRFLEREAGAPLLRFEAAEDLVQGVHYEALRSADNYEHRSDAEFKGWMFRVARRHLKARREHWFALKRSSGKVLRQSLHGLQSESGIPLFDPMDSTRGPATRALRRDQLVQITKALALLMPRDRQLVRWTCEGMDPEVQAERLELTRDSAERARLRAFERLKKAFKVLDQL